MSLEQLKTLHMYERQGECNRFCGRCCSLDIWRKHPLWAQQLEPMFNSLPFKGENANGECAHLVWVNGRAECSIYEDRPQICRDFPNHPLSVSVIPECSFKFKQKGEL